MPRASSTALKSCSRAMSSFSRALLDSMVASSSARKCCSSSLCVVERESICAWLRSIDSRKASCLLCSSASSWAIRSSMRAFDALRSAIKVSVAAFRVCAAVTSERATASSCSNCAMSALARASRASVASRSKLSSTGTIEFIAIWARNSAISLLATVAFSTISCSRVRNASICSRKISTSCSAISLACSTS